MNLVVGCHGCDREVGQKVLLSGSGLVPSDNSWDWLGAGIYFWEHGPARALQWAEAGGKGGKIEKPFVLGAFIHLGRCLDLTDTSAIDTVAQWYADIQEAMQAAGQPMPANRPLHKRDGDAILRDLDCAVLNAHPG